MTQKNKIPKFDIPCQQCCGTFHETTAQFKPEAIANGAMFSLKQSPRDAGWNAFPEAVDTEFDDLCCPSCEAPYVDALGRIKEYKPAGYIEVEEEKKEDKPDPPPPRGDCPADKVICPVCGKFYKEAGLPTHMRAKHPDQEA